jgi:hypothetical protein
MRWSGDERRRPDDRCARNFLRTKIHGLATIFLLLSTGNLVAQVPVVQEPHHRVIFQNDYVRLIDVWIKPGDTTLYHIHQQPSAVVYLSKTFTGSQPLGGVASSGQNYPGNTFYAPYDIKPITHRVWNQDTVVFHVLDIELLHPARLDSCPPQASPAIELAWDQKLAACYRIHLAVGKSLEIPASGCAGLLILISGLTYTSLGEQASAKSKLIKPGDFNFYGTHRATQITNEGSNDAVLVLLVLKRAEDQSPWELAEHSGSWEVTCRKIITYA